MNFFIRSSQLLALAVLLGCGGRSAESGPAPENTATLQVENQGFTDMVIYALRDGQRTRLGLVTGNSTQSLTIPSYVLLGSGPIRFLADPVGGTRGPVSEEMPVQPGDVVTLTIPPS
jgi:hypothetical protein